MFSALIYGVHTMRLAQGLGSKLDAAHIRCARRALGIRPTYTAKLIGAEPATNQHVAQLSGLRPIRAEVHLRRYQVPGHVLRRGGADRCRAVSHDMFGNPKVLAGANR